MTALFVLDCIGTVAVKLAHRDTAPLVFWDTNLQPGNDIIFLHVLDLLFVVKLVHHAVDQINQGLHQAGVRR